MVDSYFSPVGGGASVVSVVVVLAVVVMVVVGEMVEVGVAPFSPRTHCILALGSC